MIDIRPLTAGHIEAIIRLWDETGLPYRPRGRDRPEALAAQIEADRELFLGAFAGPEGDLVGTVVGSIDGRQKGWVNRLAVHPDHRRRGVARRLVAAIEARLEARGALLITALIEVDNEASLVLFQTAGYEELRDLIYFRKTIVPGA